MGAHDRPCDQSPGIGVSPSGFSRCCPADVLVAPSPGLRDQPSGLADLPPPCSRYLRGRTCAADVGSLRPVADPATAPEREERHHRYQTSNECRAVSVRELKTADAGRVTEVDPTRSFRRAKEPPFPRQTLRCSASATAPPLSGQLSAGRQPPHIIRLAAGLAITLIAGCATMQKMSDAQLDSLGVRAGVPHGEATSRLFREGYVCSVSGAKRENFDCSKTHGILITCVLRVRFAVDDQNKISAVNVPEPACLGTP